MDSSNTNEIIVYGTVWCGDTRRARRYMDENHIAYKWVDIDTDLQARKFVESVNHGYRSVPTIIFPDGSMLVEPSIGQLAAKFGIPQV